MSEKLKEKELDEVSGGYGLRSANIVGYSSKADFDTIIDQKQQIPRDGALAPNEVNATVILPK